MTDIELLLNDRRTFSIGYADTTDLAVAALKALALQVPFPSLLVQLIIAFLTLTYSDRLVVLLALKIAKTLLGQFITPYEVNLHKRLGNTVI